MKCSRDKCPRSAHRKGLCHGHYDNYRKTKPCGRIPIQPVRDHLNRLFEAGMSRDRIAELAGVSRASSIKRAFAPDRKYILASTAAKLLAVPVPTYATPSKKLCKWIPAIGTVRRLQALVAIGYRQREMWEHLGCCQKTLTKVITGQQERVRTDFAQRVDVMFREWELTPKHDVRALRRAKKSGWAPPLAWDDIDDPTAQPDLGGVADFAEVLEDFRAAHRDDQYIADFLGMKVDSLRQKIRRLEKVA